MRCGEDILYPEGVRPWHCCWRSVGAPSPELLMAMNGPWRADVGWEQPTEGGLWDSFQLIHSMVL